MKETLITSSSAIGDEQRKNPSPPRRGFLNKCSSYHAKSFAIQWTSPFFFRSSSARFSTSRIFAGSKKCLQPSSFHLLQFKYTYVILKFGHFKNDYGTGTELRVHGIVYIGYENTFAHETAQWVISWRADVSCFLWCRRRLHVGYGKEIIWL